MNKNNWWNYYNISIFKDFFCSLFSLFLFLEHFLNFIITVETIRIINWIRTFMIHLKYFVPIYRVSINFDQFNSALKITRHALLHSVESTIPCMREPQWIWIWHTPYPHSHCHASFLPFCLNENNRNHPLLSTY